MQGRSDRQAERHDAPNNEPWQRDVQLPLQARQAQRSCLQSRLFLRRQVLYQQLGLFGRAPVQRGQRPAQPGARSGHLLPLLPRQGAVPHHEIRPQGACRRPCSHHLLQPGLQRGGIQQTAGGGQPLPAAIVQQRQRQRCGEWQRKCTGHWARSRGMACVQGKACRSHAEPRRAASGQQVGSNVEQHSRASLTAGPTTTSPNRTCIVVARPESQRLRRCLQQEPCRLSMPARSGQVQG